MFFNSSRFFAVALAAATMLLSLPAAADKSKSQFNGLEYEAYDSPADIPAHVFARDRELSQVRLSPDGKYLLMVEPRENLYRISVLPTDENDDGDYFSIHVKQHEFRSAEWGSKNRVLVVNQALSWGKNWRVVTNRVIFAAQYDSKSTERLLHVKFEKDRSYTSDTILHYLPDDPNQVLVTYSENGKDWPAIFKLDIYTGETEKVSEGQKYIDDWYVDGDGNPRFGMGWDEDDFHMVARTSANGAWRRMDTSKIGNPDRFAFMGFDPKDDGIAFVRTTIGGDRDKIYEFDLATGEIGAVKYDNGKLDAGWLVRHQHDKSVLAGYTYGDMLEKHYFDPYFEKVDRQLDAALPGRDNYIYQITPDNKSAIVYSDHPQYPGAFYYYNFDDRQLTIFNETNPALNPDYLADVKAVRYKARDGLEIPGYLTVPQNSDGKKVPLVVMPHGGPWVRDHQQYDFWAQFIASRGYAVLQPNFRGSGGYGRAFEEAGYGEWGGKMITDMVDGVQHLADQGTIDKDKVCIMGASYGGYAALMGAINHADTFKCAMAVAPVADLKVWAKRLKKKGGRESYQRVVGTQGSKVFKTQSPVKLAKKLNIPLVIIHGVNDRRVDIEHSEDMVKALEKAGKKPKFVKLESEGHSLGMAKSRTRVLRETERMLEEYLGS